MLKKVGREAKILFLFLPSPSSLSESSPFNYFAKDWMYISTGRTLRDFVILQLLVAVLYAYVCIVRVYSTRDAEFYDISRLCLQDDRDIAVTMYRWMNRRKRVSGRLTG